MTKIKIHFTDNESITQTYKNVGFKQIILSLFKKRFYVCLTTDGSPKIAINTDNILFVEEILK